MPDQLSELLRKALSSAIEAGDLPEFTVDDLGFERPSDPQHGDWTSTIAMRSARLARMAPNQIAKCICAHLPKDPAVERVEIAGPGFINFYLATAAAQSVITKILQNPHTFGRSDLGNNQKVQLEFVSANPVGPLHIGHGRWAALGDSLARVMEFAGYEVQREYYINDHGTQLDVFGISINKRYEQLCSLIKDGKTPEGAHTQLLEDRDAYVRDEDDKTPELHPYTDDFNQSLDGKGYGGDYIVDIALRFWNEGHAHYNTMSAEERIVAFREAAYLWMLDSIEATCAKANCHFDVWFSERSLYEPKTLASGASEPDAVTKALDELTRLGYLYTGETGALWFRSTEFGDDKDRVLIKTNGEYTYFASDVAYHWNKFQRVDHVIDIWGADHHGYIQRVKSACTALGYPTQFEVLLGQLVNLLRDGKPVRMSKRKGTMVSFDELLDEVGSDATRYTLISKSANQMIDFDIERAKRQDATNPVYYVQYAHARICSILRRANQHIDPDQVDLSLLVADQENALARKLSEFPGLVEGCARDRAPFRLTHYAEELAASFHAFYTVCQVLPSETRPLDHNLSYARLALIEAVKIVLARCLELVGVHAPTKM